MQKGHIRIRGRYWWVGFRINGKEHREVARDLATGEKILSEDAEGKALAQRFLAFRLGDSVHAMAQIHKVMPVDWTALERRWRYLTDNEIDNLEFWVQRSKRIASSMLSVTLTKFVGDYLDGLLKSVKQREEDIKWIKKMKAKQQEIRDLLRTGKQTLAKGPATELEPKVM